MVSKVLLVNYHNSILELQSKSCFALPSPLIVYQFHLCISEDAASSMLNWQDICI